MATGGSYLSAQLPENRIYLFRLQILIVDGGLLVLRNILDQSLNVNNLTLGACLSHEKQKITSLKNRGVITQAQYDILYPAGRAVPSTLDMDITLITCLLRNIKCFGLNTKFNWSATPVGTDLSVEADILRLKKYRNDICHISTTTGIQHKRFTTWWKDIEQILIRLDSSVQKPVQNIQKVIDGYEKSPIDTQIEKRIQHEIKKWNNIEANVDYLKEGIVEIKEDVDVIKDDLKRLQDESTQKKEKGNIFQRFLQWFRYGRAKRNLKNDLIKFYRRTHSKVQLSPLFEEKDTPLASFYVRPDISQVKSLSDMFKTGSNSNKEIYLIADAGLGKTTFSKYLVNSWCQSHCPEKKDITSFEKDDKDCMLQFEFVFLVILRDSYDLCSIDDLIFELIISNLAHSRQFGKGFLEEIMNRENYLVILDGLDEWTHPENPRKPCYKTPRSIPHRNYRETCTVLTTTRPWKLGVLNLNSTELGKEVNLTKLSNESAGILTRRTLQILKCIRKKNVLIDEVEKFMKEIKGYHKDELIQVPLLLMYMICLWCDGEEIGNSKCELYVNIVELLLSRTTLKYGDLISSCEPSVCDVPECFTNHDHCIKYFKILSSLGKLAYHTLFNERREFTLVFDRSVAESCCNDDDMKLSLLSGLLTESTTRTLTKRTSKVSFAHKTIQEFFTALFICSQSDRQKTILCKCKDIESILGMSSVFEFISGINATMMCDISKGFMSVINENDKVFDDKRIQGNPLYHINKMFVSCLKEITGADNTKLCLQDLFLDGYSERDIKCLSRLDKDKIKSLYINTNDISISLREIIELSSLSDLKYLQKVYYEGDGEEADINSLLFPCLQSLSLWEGKWTNYKGNLSERLEQIQDLQYLYIDEFLFSHKLLETLFNFISSKKTLKDIRFWRLECTEHGRDCKRMELDLSRHLQLAKVELDWIPTLRLNITTPSLVNVSLNQINLGDSSLLISPKMLNIERMELSFIEMSAKSLQNNVKNFETLQHSVNVEMTRCLIKPEIERKRFENYIRMSKTFDVTQNEYDNDDHNFGLRLVFKTRKE